MLNTYKLACITKLAMYVQLNYKNLYSIVDSYLYYKALHTVSKIYFKNANVTSCKLSHQNSHTLTHKVSK